jgi:predicted Zn-dependent peptidase
MIDTEYLTHTFPNGIRLIHQGSDSPVAHLGIIVNTGSRDELAEEHGIAHFIEHCIFKGTKNRKAYHILSRMEDVGGELNAYTTKEETALYATFLSSDYHRAVELLSDILFNSVFPDKELKLEKEVVVEEINSYNDSPSELIFDDFDELIFDGHPIAVGKLSPKKFEQLVIRYFEGLPEKNHAVPRLPFSGYKPGNIETTKDTFQSHCIVGAEAYHIDHPMRLPLVLLNNILGGSSMNSRLNMSLREKNGLVYNVEANYTPYTDTGIFTVYFGTERNNLYKANDLVMKEFKTLRSQKMNPKALVRAKRQLIGQLAIANENREDLLLTLGRSYLYFNKIDSLETLIAKIDGITDTDIYNVANEILRTENLSKLIFL